MWNVKQTEINTKKKKKGKIWYVHRMEDLIRSKWPCYESNVQMQWDTNQTTNGIFFRSREKDPKIHMETEDTPKSLKQS